MKEEISDGLVRFMGLHTWGLLLGCPMSASSCLQKCFASPQRMAFPPSSELFFVFLGLSSAQSSCSACASQSAPTVGYRCLLSQWKKTTLWAWSKIWFMGCKCTKQSPVICNVRDGLAPALQLIRHISIKYEPTLSGLHWCKCMEECICNHNKEREKR